jgi:hypothetical protein
MASQGRICALATNSGLSNAVNFRRSAASINGPEGDIACAGSCLRWFHNRSRIVLTISDLREGACLTEVTRSSYRSHVGKIERREGWCDETDH